MKNHKTTTKESSANADFKFCCRDNEKMIKMMQKMCCTTSEKSDKS